MSSKIIYHRKETKFKLGFRIEVDTRIIKNDKNLKYIKLVRRDYYINFWWYTKYLTTKYQVWQRVYFAELLKYGAWFDKVKEI